MQSLVAAGLVFAIESNPAGGPLWSGKVLACSRAQALSLSLHNPQVQERAGDERRCSGTNGETLR